ncbi:MAG: hypothetical protein STSR0006_00930 [Lentimicrobium sp.]
MKKSAYIITKPLQYINATNIPDNSDKDCLLIKGFYDFDNFLLSVKQYSTHWSNIIVFETRIKALLYILFNKNKYSNIYLHSDSNLSTRLLLLLFQLNVFVYEEGVGNYEYVPKVPNCNYFKRIIKQLEFKFLGPNFFGSFIKTEGIYLYYPEVFKILRSDFSEKKIKKFKSNFSDHINSLQEIKNLFPKDLRNRLSGQNVIIYILSWDYDLKYKTIIKTYPGYIRILKPHPHTNVIKDIKDDFDIIISNSVPAELLISELISITKSIVIIHHGSSTLLNIVDYKIFDYNLQNGDIREEYDIILNLIRDVKS